MFTIGIAPDSFKGSLTALEAAECIERGFRNVLSNISIRKVPMADGGEGTMRALVEATDGQIITKSVRGPLGWKVQAELGITGDGKTAVIEMAAASGLVLLRPNERNPLKTSTCGTGDLIKHGLERKVKKILIGIGGSATNDGGTGMAKSLGVRFLDKKGRQLKEGGGALGDLARIDMSGLDKRLKHVTVEVACDVDNPLAGPKGASCVYGPQKGATPTMVKQLDANLKLLARIIKRDLGIDIINVPGAGAAGGLGAGLMAFIGGSLRPGIDIVIDSVKLEKKFKGCDLVVTGEGRMDGQTVFGKTPAGVARTAKKLGIPVIALCGSTGDGVRAVHSIGISACFSALQESVKEADLAKRAPEMLTICAEEVGRLLALKLKSGVAGKKGLQLKKA